MENYGNDMYLSQEGCPSIDFTLLDRPSSSIVPAPEPVAQFPQGGSSLPSFDYFDGARVEPINDHLLADHGSYMLEAQKEAMMRHTSGKLSAISSQRQGVYDFFDHESQPQRSGSDTWPRNEQSAYCLPGATNADEFKQRMSYMSSSYGPTSYNVNSKRSSLVTRMIHPPVGCTRPIVEEAMNNIKLLNVSSAMQNDVRNQTMSSQRFLNPPQSNQFKPSNSMASHNGVSHNSTMDSLNYLGAHYQSQAEKYGLPNQAGGAFSKAPGHDFLGKQVPRRGPLQPSQAPTGQQFLALTRASGFSELHSQQQLQEMFIAHQFKQLEDSRQQQILRNEFSYSDLLHGPDTPPSQHQTTGEIAIEAHESQATVLPPQNAQASGWSVDGPPSYQGSISDLHMVQSRSSTSQMSPFGEALHFSRRSGDQNGPSQSSFSEGQIAMTQYLGGGHILPSRQEMGRPMLQPGSEHFRKIPTTNVGLGNDWIDESRRTIQPHAKLKAVQNPHHPADSLLGHKIKGSGLSQVDVFSKSQQHFHELQLNEQRSFPFEQKQPVPGHMFGFLPQSNSPASKSSLKNGMQGSLNTFNCTAGYSSYQLDGIPFDIGASCEQPRWSTASSSGDALQQTVGEAGSHHQLNIWDSMPAQSQQGSDFNQQPIPYAQCSSFSNSNSQQVLQQGSPMLSVPPSSAKASAVRQREFYNTQNSLMKLSASSTGDDSKSSQLNLKAVQECRKEINEANASHRLLQPVLGPSSHFQGAWKKYTPPNQLPASVGIQGEPLDGLRHGDGFQGHGYVNSEISFHSMTMPKKPNNASVQYDPNQQTLEEQISVKDERPVERHISQDLTAGQPPANFMRTLSRETVKVVPDVVEEVQGLSSKSAGPQETLFEKQREVPEQQVDSCTTSISLAHLRGNQSSNPLSPQHVKLGLGPCNSSQDFQSVNETNWRILPQIQGLDGEVPNLKSTYKPFPAESPHGTSASDMKRMNDFESNQGTSPINRTSLQSSAAHPLVFSHRSSSPASKETAMIGASPPTSFASGHEMGADALCSAKASPYNPGHQPSQSEYGMGVDSSSGVPQVQTSPFNHIGPRDFLNGFIGKSSSISNYSRPPNYNLGVMPVQNQLFNNNMRRLNYDDGGMHVVCNHDLSNMAMKQLENRGEAVSVVGYNSALKPSLLKQSQTMEADEQEFSGIVESSQLPSNSVQGDGSGALKDLSGLMQRTQRMLSNSMKQGDKEHSMMQISFIGRQCPPDESNSQFDANNVKPSGIEERKLLSSTLHPNFQGGEGLSVSTLNGGLSSSSEGASSQDANKYQHSRPLNAFSLETDTSVKSFNRPSFKAPPSFDQGHSLQCTSHEDIQQGHSFEGLGPNARVGMLSEPAVLLESERKKLKLDSEFVGKWTVNQPTPNPWPMTGKQIARFKALQKHDVLISEDMVDKNPESLGVGHSLSPKHLDNSFVATSIKGKSTDSGVPSASFEALHQAVPFYSKPNQQTLFFAGSKEEKIVSPGNRSTPLQQSSGNKEAKLASNDLGNKLPLRLQCSNFKEDEMSTFSEVPVPTPIYEHHLSPSKTVTHSVGALHSKKRKKQPPLLIPWHIAAALPKINLPSNSYAEELWANASNRLSEKDANTTHDKSTFNISGAKRRLLLTTESMQRLFPPLPDGLMHGNTCVNKECAIYSLAKLALEDACGLVAKRNEQATLSHMSSDRVNVSTQGQPLGMADNNALAKCVESFMERVKQLGMELARLDCSTSVSELQGETNELEKLSIVNRLAKHHGIGFTMDSSDNLFIENILGLGLSAQKPSPQKYVTAAPMPRMLPGVRCLSL